MGALDQSLRNGAEERLSKSLSTDDFEARISSVRLADGNTSVQVNWYSGDENAGTYSFRVNYESRMLDRTNIVINPSFQKRGLLTATMLGIKSFLSEYDEIDGMTWTAPADMSALLERLGFTDSVLLSGSDAEGSITGGMRVFTVLDDKAHADNFTYAEKQDGV